MPISLKIISKYKKNNSIFIETGTLSGAAVNNALKAGFSKIYTIELSLELYTVACKRFEANPKVTLIHGDSGVELGKLLKKINEPCFFWIDAHYSAGSTAGKGEMPPLIKELDSLMDHKIKNHTILIDDCRIFKDRQKQMNPKDFIDTPLNDDLSWVNIMSRIAKINQNYKTSLEHGFDKEDIFVAYL